ncbi:MAG TPA: STAS domain-containing protein [Terracidiphilus sp.]|nr:STAS domain-containing protein [Terracidiphilus sp.]
MNSTYCQPDAMLVVEPAGFTELVRGTEERLVTLLAPLVQRQSVALDFGKIERIDAAGIAALITLYTDAIHSGHSFTVCNLSAHVAEILSVVGLAPILIARNTAPALDNPGRHACAAA